MHGGMNNFVLGELFSLDLVSLEWRELGPMGNPPPVLQVSWDAQGPAPETVTHMLVPLLEARCSCQACTHPSCSEQLRWAVRRGRTRPDNRPASGGAACWQAVPQVDV